jgi:hypothetical protein
MAMNGQAPIGVNLGFTKFLFIVADDDPATLLKIRSAGTNISRGFFNDYDADGVRDPQPQETIQFLSSDKRPDSRDGIGAARHVVQLSANYRPRLEEVATEFTRRLGGAADLIVIDGAERAPRYTSAEMQSYAYKPALARQSGRVADNAIILPLSKTREWWQKAALERHAYFYPHQDGAGRAVNGHARAAEAGIPTIYRKLYHNPDGYERAGEFDFVTYFECVDQHVSTFDTIRRALRDEKQNPEWKFVREGPEWRGKRVLRW